MTQIDPKDSLTLSSRRDWLKQAASLGATALCSGQTNSFSQSAAPSEGPHRIRVGVSTYSYWNIGDRLRIVCESEPESTSRGRCEVDEPISESRFWISTRLKISSLSPVPPSIHAPRDHTGSVNEKRGNLLSNFIVKCFGRIDH
jgi:hypothetical protein